MRTDYGAFLRLLELIKKRHESSGRGSFNASSLVGQRARRRCDAQSQLAWQPIVAVRREAKVDLRRPSRRKLAG